VGKMLFARQGKKFDYDLKQVGSHILAALALVSFIIQIRAIPQSPV
jgi:hypothetical protein